jgi:hypothetical protein
VEVLLYGVTNVFSFRRRVVNAKARTIALDGFPQALSEIKNGKVTDNKKVNRYKKKKPFLCFRILKERGAGLLPFLTPKP